MIVETVFPSITGQDSLLLWYYDLLFMGASAGYFFLLLFVLFSWQYRKNPQAITALLGRERAYATTFKWYGHDGWKHTYFKTAILMKTLLPLVVYGLCQTRGDAYLAFVLPGLILLTLLGMAMSAHE